MANNSTSIQDRSASMSSETDYAVDAAVSGGFFSADFKKHDDLKQMLDSSKDSLKLEAMKRIIGMIAKGRDASELFPAVVKNVVSKNIEVKKLVYVYLVRYAEEQQDLALLSISTFQRALKDPNQLIRASALRVLSSIRVSIIVPIMMLAIRDSVNDLSPYVRKTAALAIPKLYSLDPELKDELVLIIEKLLSDKTTLVVGSAVTSFEQVCPERIDLIHKNYRKLCSVLIDVEEWGQVIIINMLTRYARTQFVDPNLGSGGLDDHERPFYEDPDEEARTKNAANGPTEIDPDLRLLIRNTRPLLQSRNSSVVMAVAQLYYHVAPRSELGTVVKALVRILRSHKEIQSVVLTSIASMTVERPEIFEPFLKNFFVRVSDPCHVTTLKLEILTNLANEANITFLLREFQTYIGSNNKDLVAATIQAIGRCAARIKEITDVCLGGLVALLSNTDELIVAESVIVIKKLLQTQPECHAEIIRQMARLVDRISVPQARAAILWLLGENCNEDGVASLAPDVLRVMAKSFASEQDAVKLQILNLATKLCLTNPKQTKLLCQYVFSLAKYDQNYDIRDRARFLRQFLFPTNDNSKLAKHAKRIFLASKPAPTVESTFKSRKEFQLGSLSHYLNARAASYRDLPSFPAVAPDPSVRNVEPPKPVTPFPAYSPAAGGSGTAKGHKKKSFYSDSSDEQNGTEESSSDDSSGTSDSDSDSSATESESESGSESESESESRAAPTKPAKKIVKAESESETETSSGSDTENSESESESGSDDSSTPRKNARKKQSAKSNLDLLLDLDAMSLDTPVLPAAMQPSGYKAASSDVSVPVPVSSIPVELISGVGSGCGLQVLHRYSRSPYSYSSAMVAIELTLVNTGSEALKEIKVASKLLPPGLSMHEFPAISSLEPGEKRLVSIGIDFGDSTQSVGFDISASGKLVKLSIKPPIGELIKPLTMDEENFLQQQAKLKGMNEHSCSVPSVESPKVAVGTVYRTANLATVKTSEPRVLRFAGQSLSTKSPVLVTLRLGSTESKLTVNCEKLIVGSILLNELKEAFNTF